MSATYADFDFSKYPVVYITMNPVSPTIEQQTEFFQQFERILEKEQKAMVIFNSKHQKLTSSETRIQAGNWLKNNQEGLKSKVRVIIFTESSIWLQIVLKAIFLVATLPVPMHVVNNYHDAKKILEREYNYKITD
jgi:hypothetical protein